MQPYLDSTAVVDDGAELARRMDRDGHLFVRDLLPAEILESLRLKFLGVARNAGWVKTDTPLEEIELAVYNLAGQKLATLAHGLRVAGAYTLRWNGRDSDGRELASGVYLYRLKAGERVETRTMLFLK